MIEFEVEEKDGAAVVRPVGRLDMVAAPQFRGVVDEAVGKGLHQVVIDCSGIEFLDSSGLGAVVAGLKRARQAGGDLRIANVSGQALMVLELTTLDRVRHAYGSVDEALRAHP